MLAGPSTPPTPLPTPLSEFTDEELDNAQAFIGPYERDLEPDQSQTWGSMPPPSQQVRFFTFSPNP